MRTLASIQIISDIQPIEGADFIEMARVMGWQLVVKKNEFKVGDKCCFFEIDSLLDPTNPAFEFMEKNKYRVKTVKMRGQISQGLALPVSILPEEYRDEEEGFDLTEITGTIQWYPPRIGRREETAGSFPGYVNKTDETRIQSITRVLEKYKGTRMYATVKVDGTSSTFSILDGEIKVCSRARAVKDKETSVYWRMYRKYNLEEVLRAEGDIAIQGEIAGFWREGRQSAIQKNRLRLADTELFIFDVYKIKEARYLGFEELVAFCNKYKLQMVPVEAVDFPLDLTLEQILAMAEGLYPNGHQREGLVFRSMVDLEKGARLSFKAISNRFLLKTGE